MYKIFIIEDDSIIRNEISKKLIEWDYETVLCRDFKNVDKDFKKVNPDLVLLDISLPFYNGFYWCQKIRESSLAPIIFISSANDSLNIVNAINYGGDDFLEKPFDLNVLVAKVQAQLRRAYNMKIKDVNIIYDNYIINLQKLRFETEDTSFELSKNEIKILQILVLNKGKVISREELITQLWDSDLFIDDNTLTVNINRLRKKLEENNIENFIKTKKGIGYYAI